MRSLLSLRERTRHLVRLDSLDVAFLQAQPRSWFRLERVAGARRHLLTVGGIAGAIQGPTCRFVIAPKLPLTSLPVLLDLEPAPPTEALPDGDASDESLLETLALAFLHHLRERVREGLHRGYQEQATAGPILRGRIDLPAQLRQGPTRHEVLHQVVDTFTQDIPCNQILCSALDALARFATLTVTTQAEVLVQRGRLQEIQALPADAWGTALDVPPGYAVLHDLARLLLGGLPGAAGARPGVGFILELERLYERYVLRGLQQAAAPGVVVEPQPRRILCGEGLALVVQPDALVLVDGQPVQVLDAKWKRLIRGRANRADLYQALAYADTLGVARAGLIYPGRRLRVRRYPTTRRGTIVSLWTVPIVPGVPFGRVLSGG